MRFTHDASLAFPGDEPPRNLFGGCAFGLSTLQGSRHSVAMALNPAAPRHFGGCAFGLSTLRGSCHPVARAPNPATRDILMDAPGD